MAFRVAVFLSSLLVLCSSCSSGTAYSRERGALRETSHRVLSAFSDASEQAESGTREIRMRSNPCPCLPSMPLEAHLYGHWVRVYIGESDMESLKATKPELLKGDKELSELSRVVTVSAEISKKLHRAENRQFYYILALKF